MKEIIVFSATHWPYSIKSNNSKQICITNSIYIITINIYAFELNLMISFFLTTNIKMMYGP